MSEFLYFCVKYTNSEMKKIQTLTLTTILLAAPFCGLSASQVVLNTPSNHQVLSVSPNGKWACGVYTDANNTPYGFRWNLETGTIEMLSSTDESTAWDIANDGTVSGNFADTSITFNHAPVQMVGFYRDGKWNSVELPAAGASDGIGYGITPDGHYISGSLNVGGVYTPYIWKDGKIDKELYTGGSHAMPYAIAPDGQGAGGWVMRTNRAACYWGADNSLDLMLDSPQYKYFFNNCAKSFSPDGKKLLYWGGWEVVDDDLYLWALYDVATGERKRIKAPSIDATMEFYDISNDGILVGANQERGYVYVSDEDKCYYVDEYLEKCGVDIDELRTVFYEGELWDATTLPVTRVASISEDSKTIALLYWDKTQEMSSMVIKLDVDTEKTTPAEITAVQLEGLYNVGITWKTPYNVTGCSYNVYRDGTRVSGLLPLRNMYFYDKNVSVGTHVYSVELITPSGSRNTSETIEVNVTDPALSVPLSLSANQKGLSDAHLTWEAPLSNKTIKTYTHYGDAEVLGFSVYQDVEMEAAIKFDSHEMSNYTGYAIDEVGFVPVSQQKSWTVKIYSQSTTDGSLTLLTSQPVTQELVYGVRNSVRLDNPVAMPVQGNLIVAIAVDVDSQNSSVLGAEMGPVKAGYTDLLRQSEQDDFFSTYDSSMGSGYVCTCMTWMIDASLTPDGYSEADNALSHYNVYSDGEKVSQTTDSSVDITNLNIGAHTFGVQAQYANGSLSDIVSTTLSLDMRYPAVNNLKISQIGEKTINVQWDEPSYTEHKSVTYTNQASSTTGVTGDSSNGYAIMAASDYPAAMFTGYDGYRISSLRFYPLADAVFSLILYRDGEEISYIEVDNYTLNQWNEVEVPDEIFVEKGCTYRLVVDCFDPTPEVKVLAVDSNPCFVMVSDMYSLDNGESFSSLSADASLANNWMMSIELTNGDVIYPEVTGYDMLFDGVVTNDSRISSNECEYEMSRADTRRHSVKINTYYKQLDQLVSGTFNYFSLNDFDGIADGVITEITLNEGDNYLVAAGEAVKSISVVSIAGIQMAYAEGDRVNISSLTHGVYVVTVTLENGATVTRKITIR